MTTTAAPLNRGRIINFITGISGVSPGSQALVNIPVNQRVHRLVFQCAAVNYSSLYTTEAHPASLLPINTSGNGAAAYVTVVNGQVTAATITAGGTGYAAGDTLTFSDPTGSGVILTVATESTGAIETLTVTSGGIASPIDPVTFFSSVKLLVNGVNMRDISPASVIGIAQINGYPPQLGNLPIYFTEPWRNLNRHNEVTSWDLFNQGTFQVQLGISSTVVSPSLVGFIEFDYFRNAKQAVVSGKQTTVYFLAPVSHHQFTQQLVAGRNDVNQLPWTNPISRIWIAGANPGNIYQLEVYQDGNKVLEATQQQIQEAYAEYGFQFVPLLQNQYEISNNEVIVTDQQYVLKAPYGVQLTSLLNISTNGNMAAPPPASQLGLMPANVFDVAFIADPDQRLLKALKCASSLNVRVYCNVPQAVTFVMEALPGAYSA